MKNNIKIRVSNKCGMSKIAVQEMREYFARYICSRFKEENKLCRIEAREEFEVTVEFVAYLQVGNTFYTFEGMYDKIWHDIEVIKSEVTGVQTAMF